MSDNASYTGTHTDVNTDTDISRSHTLLMFPIIPYFEGSPLNLTGGIFTTGTGLSASMFSFVNISTS